MNTNPENPKGWTLPAEIPPAFALPEQFRASLPDEVRQWLHSVERRIDGLTLRRIEKEAEELAGEDSPEARKLYRLGRRIFFTRMEQIVELMFPGGGVEVGINLLWEEVCNETPGCAVSTAVIDGENINQSCLEGLEAAGFVVN